MPTDTALRLEQRGLAATWSGLRVAYAAGGDGESDTRVDLRNFAAFVRDPTALVTCLLLPHCCSVRLEMQVHLPGLQDGPPFMLLMPRPCILHGMFGKGITMDWTSSVHCLPSTVLRLHNTKRLVANWQITSACT